MLTFTAYYSQGMPVPGLNSVQSGETYYYSEAVGNVLRVVDMSGTGEQDHLLTTYFYKVEDAKKVATMLHPCSLNIYIKND